MENISKKRTPVSKPNQKPQSKPKPKPAPKPKPKSKPFSSALTGANAKPSKVKPPKGGNFLGNRPEPGKGVNAPEVVRGTNQAGTQFTAAQLKELGPAFKTLSDQQYRSITRIADGLDNQYTKDARAAVKNSLEDANQINALGDTLAEKTTSAFQSVGPTEIEQKLYDQGQAELALGRSLSQEQLRDATQSARQAFAARGLGVGMGAAAAELLNRDRYATERESQRRQFAAGANQMREENVLARQDSAGRLGALSGSLLGDSSRLRQAGAGMMADLDPMQRALQPGLVLGGSAQTLGLNTIGQNFANSQDLFANTASFNVNRGDSLYNSWLNNATAIKTGQTAANAQTTAANISAAATRDARPKWWETALGAVGNIFSDERMKTDIKPLGTAGSILGLPAYEFRYKGEKKKHKGFMAQDVQRVLPEAVEEMNYKGKKRLTIKPLVIGQALAKELTAAKAP